MHSWRACPFRTLKSTQFTITEKIAAVYFASDALRSKIYKKANGYLLKDIDVKQEVDLFILL